MKKAFFMMVLTIALGTPPALAANSEATRSVTIYHSPEMNLEEVDRQLLDQVGNGSTINFAAFILSDYKIMDSLRGAADRGARIRIYLDPKEILTQRFTEMTFECACCGKQTSVTAGTIMHGTHLPLRTWFIAAHLVATHSNGISALQLQGKLGIGSYKAAWLLLHKFRKSMVDPDRDPLARMVEVHETSIAFRTKDDPVAGGQGRSHDGKSSSSGPSRASKAVRQDASGCR